MAASTCRLCGRALARTFCDLGLSPLSNSYVPAEALDAPETYYPLHVYVCEGCLLVQLPEVVPPERIFSDYAYFSSYSDTWLEHARRYVDMAVERFGLGPGSKVVEIASNDGYLLRWLVARGIPVLGVEPARNVAQAARAQGIPTVSEFFGRALAERLRSEGHAATLVVANNVLAHVPALNDFVAGVATLLASDGVATFEFPHLLRLIRGNQFDTIYHEHYSYFTLHVVRDAFAAHRLLAFDVEELATHGGSLRVYLRRAEAAGPPESEALARVLVAERTAGLDRLEGHLGFEEQVRATKRRVLRFLIDAREAGRTVAAYGAPAKGNTLLVYCGVGPDLVELTVDRNPHKQGRFLPGSRIPIHAPERIADRKPDYLWILPWNLRDEVVAQMAHIREWGGRFVVAIPEVEILP